jgi:cysteine desulfurase
MLPYLRQHFGNPSSAHRYGIRAREAVEQARAEVADLLGCSSDEIVFTSGGTEANNLAIRGAMQRIRNKRDLVLTSSIEHPATARPCAFLGQNGCRVVEIPVDRFGVIQLRELERQLSGRVGLVTVIHANNEVGTIQPIAEIARAAREAGALMHTDAAQSVGKIEVSVARLEVDLLSLAAHKLYGPKGVGALYLRRGVILEPVILGAGHERGLRPGTEDVASIVGFGVAARIAKQDVVDEGQRLRALAERLHRALVQGVPGIQLNGHTSERLPNTLNLSFPKVVGADLLACTTEVAASTGSACHAGKPEPSAVLRAMGLDETRAVSAVRLSLGRSTTEADMQRAARALIASYQASLPPNLS